jgi:hypothetical protein
MINNFLFLLFSFFFSLIILFFRSDFFNFYQYKILGLKLFLIQYSLTFRFVVPVLSFLFISFLQGGIPNPTFCADFIVESVAEPMDLDQIETLRATNNNIPPNSLVTTAGQVNVSGLTTPEISP